MFLAIIQPKQNLNKSSRRECLRWALDSIFTFLFCLTNGPGQYILLFTIRQFFAFQIIHTHMPSKPTVLTSTQRPITNSIQTTTVQKHRPSSSILSIKTTPPMTTTTAKIPDGISTSTISSTTLHSQSLTGEQNEIPSETTANDLSSPTDTNDISDENPDQPKRYTLSAAKSAGKFNVRFILIFFIKQKVIFEQMCQFM